MTETILICGAGPGQLPAIEAARALGIRSLVVDRNGDAPGMALADAAEAIDIVDVEGVVDAARRHGVGAAMTLQSDIGVPTVGAVVDALGLAGNTRAVADRCSNKIETRKALATAGVPQPRFAVAADEAEALTAAREIGFPCIVKAPDSSGSRGVVKASGEEDVAAAYEEARRWSRVGLVLVEEFISGHEIGAQAFSLGGRCRSVQVHNDFMSPPPYMIPVGHSFPPSLPADVLRATERAVSACVDALGILWGPSNIDFILRPGGEPAIIEVGARLGATCLPELVTCYTGIDWVSAAVLAAFGCEVALAPRVHQPCAAFILEAPDDGVLSAVHLPEDMLALPDVLEVEVTARPGERVSRLRKGTDRIGKVVTRGETLEAAEKLALDIRNAIRFDIEAD
ncbi:ATP-grasp domain-containing protein [Parvibaculum sp.]|uniref:ATP-grasp domain-containing protein n=1 Tax=Parvibaculum sp. TaxID=2024848 RepID=UPI001B1CB111|nr:ATP-grasp domain-containing protein [Parvibaculum sp.]MBO6668006.1 ATP-grasp domain-containing protein [Parvibaculum sp.]MBO6690619.1 ATP-grasp domain-containing protein [Parvibaculum sp.]MBO6714758.1 ATP-grasp domain-containing protein [Parvibaculum sp.]